MRGDVRAPSIAKLLHLACAVATANALLLALDAGAQPPKKVAHVALLTHLHPSPFQDGFFRRLAELGHVEGRNLVVTRRYGQGSDELLVLHVREVLRQRIDLVFTPSGPATRAVKSETDKIPIVAFDMEIDELFRRCAAVAARILEGAKPADLPVERPGKYELVINLKTAKALDLTIPSRLLVMADEALR